MVIRSDKIGQSWLLPLAVSELIPEDHICNLVEVVVDNMDVGEISFPIEENRPRFEKDIVCPGCGVLTMDEVELTELGQTQLGAIFMA